MYVTLVRSERPARPLIAGAVLLLHTVPVLALFWTNLGQHARPQLRERTIWLNLQAATHPQAVKRTRKDVLQRPLSELQTPSGSARSANIPVFSLPIEPDRKNLLGLQNQLFNCAPENYANLDETQRSRCRNLGTLPTYDPNTVDYADRSDQVPGAKRWKLELARKQAPLLLPCGNASGINPIYTGACILENLAKGFSFKEQYESQPAYFDKPKKSHVDNNGDPPPIYRDRDH